MLARIRSSRSGLSPAEQAVAEQVLARPDEAIRLNVETLAERARVSAATVLRFCRALGFSGFKDFKISLAAATRSTNGMLPEAIDLDDAPMEVASKVLMADVRALHETLELLDGETLTRAVEALEHAERVEVYGIGSSAPIALDAYYRLLRIGLRVSVVTDAHIQAVSASLLDERAVALVVSHTGRTRETLDAARRARESGATVVGLTSFFKTPLLEQCHVALITATSETTMEAMASRIAHLAVVDALHVILATRRYEQSLITLGRTGGIIEQKRS